MKKLLTLALTAVLLTASVCASTFNKTQTYSDGLFTDVAPEAWYSADVESSYEFGLVNGVGNNKFDPNGTVTVAQAITLAARFSAAYNNEEIPDSDGEWYTPYVNYATDKNIITDNQFDSYTRAAKRFEVAMLFAASLPEDYFKPMNSVYSIPDVSEDKTYYEALMMLYKAGIAMGSDAKGTFNPDTNITRAEFSALINRVAAPGMRLAKSFDTTPREDSYLLVDATVMGAVNNSLPLPNGWLCDNKNAEDSKDGMVTSHIVDGDSEEYVALYRDFDEIKSGSIILEHKTTMMSPDNGFYIGFADADGKVNVKLMSDYGVFTLCGKEETKTDIAFATDIQEVYAIMLYVDLDTDKMYAYINGQMTQKVDIPDGISLNRLVIGSTVEGKAFANPELTRLYQNYATAERFIGVKSMVGSAPYTLNTYGDIKLYEYRAIDDSDVYSAKINAKKGDNAVASKSFARIYEKGIFETYILLPEYVDGAYFTITSGGSDALKIYTKDGAWYAGDKMLRKYTANVWQTIRIETDAKAGNAVVKICGKAVGTVDFSAEYIDGLKIGIDPDKDAVMWFDDILAYNYIDHEDYPKAPKANNDDDYNVGVHVCNLWHDAAISEGWQAVTAFDEFEPYMGYYDEGSPEAADWELKMMAEHGIDFQNMCWYAGIDDIQQPLKKPDISVHAIHEGYFNAKYSDSVKFCIMWENYNNGANVKNLEQFKEYIWKYWKEYYFSDPRYMVIDNMPIITYWDYNNLVKGFGGVEQTKAAIEFMREDIKTLGFDDIIILIPNRDEAQAAAIGVDGMFYYHYSQPGSSADYQITTLNGRKDSSVHVVPTLAIGHNGIGRYDQRTSVIDLEGHKRVAEYIKNDYLEGVNTNTWKDNTLFVSNWNEFSEGHYINPTNTYGYGYLETVKDVFTNDKSDHTSLDVKLTDEQKSRITKMYPDTHHQIRLHRNVQSQYDLEELVVNTSWDFSKDETYDTWKLISIEVDEKTEKGLKGHGTNVDPVVETTSLNLDISSSPVIHIRMSSEVQTLINVFFKTADSPIIEGNIKIKNVQSKSPGEIVDYYIDMSDIPEWSGNLIGLRVDPVNGTSAFELELIEILSYEAETASVIANGSEMIYDFNPVIVDGDVQVTANPRNGFFSRLNLFYVWNRHTGELTVESKTNKLVLTVGSDKALLDGKTVNLGYTFDLYDGLPVIRLGKFCEMLGFEANLSDNVMTVVTTEFEIAEDKGYFGWDFDKEMNYEGWLKSTATNIVTGGMLKLVDPRISDVQVFSSNININAYDYDRLTVGIMVDPEKVKGHYFQIFYDSNGMGYSEKNSLKVNFDDLDIVNGEVYEIEFDLTKHEGWKGTIVNLRLDPFNTKVDCAIDYIRLYPAEKKDGAAEEESTVKMTEIQRFDFDSPDEIAGGVGHNTTLSVSGGYLNIIYDSSADMGILFNNTNFSADSFNMVKVGIRTDISAMAGKPARIYFGTEESPLLSEDKSATTTYGLHGKKDGDLIEIVFDLSENPEWKGKITTVRFDPYDSPANAVIDYVVIGKKD